MLNKDHKKAYKKRKAHPHYEERNRHYNDTYKLYQLIYGGFIMSRLSISIDTPTMVQMTNLMQELGFTTKASFIIYCIKLALKQRENSAKITHPTYTRTGHSVLSKESIYNEGTSSLPPNDFSEDKVENKENNSKKPPLLPLDPEWQPPTHLRHKYCGRWGVDYSIALELFHEMASEKQSTSRNWAATWCIKVKKGVLKHSKVQQDDEYLRPEDTMSFQLGR